ncbi:hypothetical protein Tco_0444454 [Tanacetum coccineum]
MVILGITLDLEAFYDSGTMVGSNLTGIHNRVVCQFLGQRLFAWQCIDRQLWPLQQMKDEYVAASNCCGQVLWRSKINLLDLWFSFSGITKSTLIMRSTICIVKKLDITPRQSTRDSHHFILLTTQSSGGFWQADESAGFAEIVDFLRGSNLRYALTTNPTIYDSLVKQFWQTATANTKADGTLEIKATIDTIRYTISEASIRDSLQLDDATGITMLPNDDLFEGMGQIGQTPYLTCEPVQTDLWEYEKGEEEELNKKQKKRKAQVQFEAQHYTNEDWDLIRAKIEANAELSKSMLGSEVQGEDFAKKMVDLVNQRKKYFAEERARAKRNKPMTQSQLKTYMMNYLKNQGIWKLSQLKNLSFEEVKKEFDKLVKQVEPCIKNFESIKQV